MERFSTPPSTPIRSSSTPSPIRRSPSQAQGPSDRPGGTLAPSVSAPGILETVDELLAAEGFDPGGAYQRYWNGRYNPDDVRGSLFGALEGQALGTAVGQLLNFGTRQLVDRPRDLEEFQALFLPLLEAATAEAAEPSAPGEASLPIDPTADPLKPRQARQVVYLLLDHSEHEGLEQVWAAFGALEGLALLRAIDQVEVALYETTLKDLIDKAGRQRIGACLQAMRDSVPVEEVDGLLAQLLRQPHPEGLGVSAQAPPDAPPLDAWGVIRHLSKGKFHDTDTAAVIELFGGRTGAELWDAIEVVGATLLEDANQGEQARVPTDEREVVHACLEDFRQGLRRELEASEAHIDALVEQVEGLVGSGESSGVSTPSSDHPPTSALGVLGDLIELVESRRWHLTPRRPLMDVRIGAFRTALLLGGLERLEELLARLGPWQQWQVLTRLVEDPELLSRYPGLSVLEADVRRHCRAAKRGHQPLEQVRNWHRLLGNQSRATPVLPPMPPGFDPADWVRMLWIMLFQQYPEPSKRRHELSRALDAYQQALGVKSDREHAQALWMDAVHGALQASSCGHGLLEALRSQLGLDAKVALALMTALAELPHFDQEQQDLIHRAAAILMAERDHNLPCIALPYLASRTPQRLNILYPVKPLRNAPSRAVERYNQLLHNWLRDQSLVTGDQLQVLEWLSKPPREKPGSAGQGPIALTPGEQCDRMLCALELPPKRVEMALMKILQLSWAPEDRERYLLVRRLLSELVYSERNYAGRNKPLSPLDIALRLLGVVTNGVREGGAHGAALFAARVFAHYVGGYALPTLGLVSVGLSFWAWYHLEHAKSPDYQLNPSPVMNGLIQVVPSLNTLALASLTLSTGILPMMNGITVPFELGEALFLMNVMRALRQVMQSGTQPFARLFRLTDEHGAGLPAQLAFFVNCVRDALYMCGSVGFLIYLARHLDGVAEQWGPPQSPAEVLLHLLLKTLPSTVNEAVDGANPDIAILLARLASWLKGAFGWGDDDLVLQHSVPMQWPAVPRHMADHIAGRSNIVGLQDPFHAASALAEHVGQHQLALFFKWVGVVLNGFLGALRGRELSYLRTTDPRASAMAPHDGFNPRNPDGLLVALGYLASEGMSRVHGLLCSPPDAATPSQTEVKMPPELLEAQRKRASTLLLSSRGRNTGTTTDDEGDESRGSESDDPGPIDPVASDRESTEDPLVELELTPRWQRLVLDDQAPGSPTDPSIERFGQPPQALAPQDFTE